MSIPAEPKKSKKKFVILGIFVMIIGSGGFVVPIGDPSFTISEVDAQCKSLLIFAQFGEGNKAASEACRIISLLLVLSNFLVITGIILVVFGLLRNKI